MWPYRDWVIQALNDDLPFDSFTIQQLAGDLLPNPTKSQLVATALHRNTLINEEGGTDAKQFRHESVVDRVNTTAAVWLGLTVGCAQCHSHKFDPISHREYYELFAFFNNTTDVNNKGATLSVARGEMLRGGQSLTISPPAEAAADGGEQTIAPESQAPAPRERRGQRDPGVAEVMVMKELDEPRETFICVRGDFLRPDKDVGPLQPDVLQAVPPTLPPAENRTRLDLARWLVNPENPLTPRVTMNRVWMRYFGRGLVETDEDFGTQGTPPTHPELLDWLAGEFQRDWSLKQMHRLIVTSSTYRQASKARPDLAEKDPRNLLLARQERLRVEAEIVRDAALSASGQLDRTIGGPSVRPPQPDGVYAFTQTAKRWTPETGPGRYRRGMYTLFFRSAPYPLFTTFDAPDFQTVCTRRIRSNTPLQALTVANDEAFFEIAQGLAARVLKELPTADARTQLRRAFRLCLCREPSPRELAALEGYYERQVARHANDAERAKAILSTDLQETEAPAVAAALVLASRAILNTDSFITRE
jgi:hypothetical protein